MTIPKTYFLLLLTMLIHLNAASQLEYHVSLGVPFGVSKEAKSFIEDSFDLEKNLRFSFGFGGRFVFKNGYFLGTDAQLAGRKYSSDSLVLKLDHSLGSVFFGKDFTLTEKISLGVSLNVGVQKASQSLYVQKSVSDAWETYQNDNFNIFYTETSYDFFLGGDIYAEYGEGKPFTLMLGLRASFLPLDKLDSLNSIPIYRNYFLPYLGVRMNLERKKE